MQTRPPVNAAGDVVVAAHRVADQMVLDLVVQLFEDALGDLDGVHLRLTVQGERRQSERAPMEANEQRDGGVRGTGMAPRDRQFREPTAQFELAEENRAGNDALVDDRHDAGRRQHGWSSRTRYDSHDAAARGAAPCVSGRSGDGAPGLLTSHTMATPARVVDER